MPCLTNRLNPIAALCVTIALGAGLLESSGFTGRSQAQEPKQNPAVGQLPMPKFAVDPTCVCPPKIPPAPNMDPKPLAGPGAVRDFLNGISITDSTFDLLVGQGRILTTKNAIVIQGGPRATVSVGDPAIVDFTLLSERQIRLVGKKLGVTDMTIVTADNQTYSFEVRVMADLQVLQCQLQSLFPDARLKLSQLRDSIVVEGQARDSVQVVKITETIRLYMSWVVSNYSRQANGQGNQQSNTQQGQQPVAAPAPGAPNQPQQVPVNVSTQVQSGGGDQENNEPVRVINLITVPGSKQVLLKVRVAELNRTAFRQIGTNLLYLNQGKAAVGTQIGGVQSPLNAMNGILDILRPDTATAFGIFSSADFAVVFSALRRNELLKILAEPNLVALNGHAANFLAGGEFPVPVPQASGGTGVASTVTVQFKEFGVKLGFLPTILDGDVIRVAVDPEVSTIDFAIGATLVAGGTPVPGLNVRRAHTVVEMREGQTLAMAGLLQLTLDGTTNRIPGLGDLPVLGPFFSNTTGRRVEKELIVLVTPHLVEPMNQCQVGPSPGDDLKTPTDLEFYLYNQIEGQRVDWRATTQYQHRTNDTKRLLRLEAANVRGPHGFSE